MNGWFEDILDEAEEEIEIEAIADPIAHCDIPTACFNATNIEYPKKEKVDFFININSYVSIKVAETKCKIYKEGNSPLKKTLTRLKRRGTDQAQNGGLRH